ncbi:ATP-binding protein [Rhodococcus sp. NPDC058521]|uniref:ATP-binding protein n=1 Tax=Rhodococcus sp. NPDC058521 TaxID=3346536 RepID=UPI00364BA00A
MTELPTGTVTLLLADVEGSTRLWETQPDEMTSAVALLDRAVSDVVSTYHGARPVEQGEGDSFVVAFCRASDAVGCALDLQRAPCAPIRLRIGIHTGEVQLRDPDNYMGPTVNRTARVRDLAHGGQTVLSGATEQIVVDRLPSGVWLTDLGTYSLRGTVRPERVVQLCHPDLPNDFPPLRAAYPAGPQQLPVLFTSFVGRVEQIDEVRQLLGVNRLVTLTGAGGVGKTRLAMRVARKMVDEFDGTVRYVDLAPITDPDVVPAAMANALGLLDQPGRSTVDTLARVIGEGRMLVLLDNCEHLLDASAELIVALLGACPELTVLATSREPIGVDGEVSWRVPSLSLDEEAVVLFTERARRVRPNFRVTDDRAAAVVEICRRLDGLPLAIELAAARVRALTLDEIVDGLHDRFHLLTGGTRTSLRRQQTLRASVDWSHALLTEPEQVLFRRLAVFLGGFDLDAAQFVCNGSDVERYQILDQLVLLVDKSLVVADESRHITRYRLLETVRQYAWEKLGESGEADAVRARHRDHYTTMAELLDTPGRADHEWLVEHTETEIDNLRAAFRWSHENGDTERSLDLASSLQPFWLARGRMREGRTWFEAVLGRDAVSEFDDALAEHDWDALGMTPAVSARALADKAVLDIWVEGATSMDGAQKALAIAREVGDPVVLSRALAACSYVAGYSYDTESATPYFAEAIELARTLDDRWRLSEVLTTRANTAIVVGDPITACTAAEEGREIADSVGNCAAARECRMCLGWVQLIQGDLIGAVARFRAVAADAESAHDVYLLPAGLMGLGIALVHQGKVSEARAAADASTAAAADVGGFFLGMGSAVSALAALSAGDVPAAEDASEAAWKHMSALPELATAQRAFNATEVALAEGDLFAARRWADDAVSVATGWHLAVALTTRARVSVAERERDDADRYARDALSCAVSTKAYLTLPDILDCIADLAGDAGGDEAARLFGGADAIRRRIGVVRFEIHRAGYEASVARLREAMGHKEFDHAWAEGAALSTDDTIDLVRRLDDERKRPASGGV